MDTHQPQPRPRRIILAAIVLLAVALRLVGITNPLIGHHSWRQTDTAAVARNFAQERYHILSPRIDWRGAGSGEVECEFPVYQFLVATLYRLFGVHETIGRLLSVLLSVAAVIGMYLLAAAVGGSATGLGAAFFMAVLPLPLFFGRTMMPEMLLLVGCVFAVHGFLAWSENGSLPALAGSCAALVTACLLKPPTLYLGLPLAYLALRRHGRRVLLRPELWAYGLVLFGCLAAWYVHAHGLQERTGLTFGVWEYGSDKWGNWDLVGSGEFWETVLVERVPELLLGYIGLPLLIAGLVRPAPGHGERVFILWFAAMLVFIVLVARGVFVHDYYLLPASVPVCYFLGKALARGLAFRGNAARAVRGAVALCAVGVMVSSLVTCGKWIGKEDPAECTAYRLARAAHRKLPRDARVVAVDKGDPLILYYSHTRGWRSFPRDCAPRWIESRRREGAEYLLGVRDDFKTGNESRILRALFRRHQTLVDRDAYFILRLSPPDTAPPDRSG